MFCCVRLFCKPVDYNLPGSSARVTFSGKNTGVGCISFSRGSSWPRNRTQVSCIAGRSFINWATLREINIYTYTHTHIHVCIHTHTYVKAMATHSSTLVWKIPWMEEPSKLQSMGSLRVGHDWATSLSLFTFMHWRRKWQLTPVFLPGVSQGQRSLVGCHLWGHTELDTTEVT